MMFIGDSYCVIIIPPARIAINSPLLVSRNIGRRSSCRSGHLDLGSKDRGRWAPRGSMCDRHESDRRNGTFHDGFLVIYFPKSSDFELSKMQVECQTKAHLDLSIRVNDSEKKKRENAHAPF